MANPFWDKAGVSKQHGPTRAAGTRNTPALKHSHGAPLGVSPICAVLKRNIPGAVVTRTTEYASNLGAINKYVPSYPVANRRRDLRNDPDPTATTRGRTGGGDTVWPHRRGDRDPAGRPCRYPKVIALWRPNTRPLFGLCRPGLLLPKLRTRPCRRQGCRTWDLAAAANTPPNHHARMTARCTTLRPLSQTNTHTHTFRND